MNLNEAYCKGLTDAENQIIDNLINLLNDPNYDNPFPNPRLEIVRQIIKDRSDYYHNLAKRRNNIGWTFTDKLKEQKEILEKAK